MICTLSKHEAEKQGYTDSLMLDHEGNIAEATGANIFFKDKKAQSFPSFIERNSLLRGFKSKIKK